MSHERRSHAAALPAQLVTGIAPVGHGAAGRAAGPLLGLVAEAPRDVSATSDAQVALLTALPFGLAAAWMLLLAKHSQATGMCCARAQLHVKGNTNERRCCWPSTVRLQARAAPAFNAC